MVVPIYLLPAGGRVICGARLSHRLCRLKATWVPIDTPLKQTVSKVHFGAGVEAAYLPYDQLEEQNGTLPMLLAATTASTSQHK